MRLAHFERCESLPLHLPRPHAHTLYLSEWGKPKINRIWESKRVNGRRGGKTHVNHQTAMKWTEIKLQNHCVNSSPK